MKMPMVEAWVLWNPKSMQYVGDFYNVPKLFHERKAAEDATPIDPESTLNAYWKPLRVRVRRFQPLTKGLVHGR